MARDFSSTVAASAGGTSYSRVYVPDFHQVPFCLSIVLTGISGSAAGTVQHTLSDPWSQDLNVSSNGTWFDHAYMVNGATAQGNYAFPVRGIRLSMPAATSATAT